MEGRHLIVLSAFVLKVDFSNFLCFIVVFAYSLVSNFFYRRDCAWFSWRMLLSAARIRRTKVNDHKMQDDNWFVKQLFPSIIFIFSFLSFLDSNFFFFLFFCHKRKCRKCEESHCFEELRAKSHRNTRKAFSSSSFGIYPFRNILLAWGLHPLDFCRIIESLSTFKMIFSFSNWTEIFFLFWWNYS